MSPTPRHSDIVYLVSKRDSSSSVLHSSVRPPPWCETDDGSDIISAFRTNEPLCLLLSTIFLIRIEILELSICMFTLQREAVNGTHPIAAILKETTSKTANNAVVFLTFELMLKEPLPFSRVATRSRKKAFSCLSFWFSLFKSDMVASSEVTYSFFFLRERQADSRFLIIRCWRLKALA